MTSVYQRLPVPGYHKGPEYTDPEILYSTAAFTQKGVTLKAGQGILPAGTVLGRNSTDKKYYAYNNAGTAGIDSARGILRRAVDTGTDANAADQLGNLVIQGILKLNMVSGADAGAISDLGAVTDTVRNTFKF